MPNGDEKWHQRKRPTLQIRILKHMALNGRLLQKDAAILFGCTSPTISEALNIMRKRNLIELDRENPPPDFKSGERQKKLYRLTNNGLIAFINEDITPYEFWITLMWYCTLNSENVNKNQLNSYYNLFIQKFVGDSFPLRNCFFLTYSFDKLFKEWRSMYDSRESNVPGTVGYFKHSEALQSFKIFECLLDNRGVTLHRIIELTKLTEQQVRKTLQDYSITTPNDCYHYIELYENTYRTDRSIETTTDYLTHLIIVPIREKEGADKNKDEEYELSLLGILLVLATVSLRRQEGGIEISHYTNKYYNIIASNYHDKLPLIFGKWRLLKEVLDFDSFPSIFDYLFLDKAEILSLSVLTGGNKEIYDNIKSAALAMINKFSIIYDEGISGIYSNDCPEGFLKSEHYQFVQDKLNEIEISLRYADFKSFAKYMISKKPNPNSNSAHVSRTFKDMPVWKVHKIFINSKIDNLDFDDDLHSIENALAEEFSLLFYIGMLCYELMNLFYSRSSIICEFSSSW